MGISQQMADVVLAAGVKIVEAEELLSLCEKPLAEVRSEKAGAAGDQNPFHVAYLSKEKMNHVGYLHPLHAAVRGTLFFWHFPRHTAINHRAILSVNQIIVLQPIFAGMNTVYEKKPSSKRGGRLEKRGR
jgi:hypothetical protein